MSLTQDQLDQFHREGWLFLPELFTPEEVDLLRQEAVAIYDQHRPEIWRVESVTRSGVGPRPRARRSVLPWNYLSVSLPSDSPGRMGISADGGRSPCNVMSASKEHAIPR